MYTIISIILSLLIALTVKVAAQAASSCAVTYMLYDTDLDQDFAVLVAGEENNLSYRPCNLNIETILSCPVPLNGIVRMVLRNSSGGIVKRTRESTAPYYLYGNIGTDILPATIADGTYSIQSFPNGKVTPSVNFTLYPCVVTES